MREAAYGYLAAYYDKLNAGVDYAGWAAFFEEACKRCGGDLPERVLDLGCGTGAMMLALLRRGRKVTGIDISAEMLAEAYRKATQEGYQPLLLCQDMCTFEVYAGARKEGNAFDAVISSLDCINYLPDTAAVGRCFGRVHAALRQGGTFVFDVNTPEKFRTVYGDRDYVLEEEGVVCTWQNHFSPKTGRCMFALTLFAEESDGRYTRYDEVQYERMYHRRTLEKLLREQGFRVEAVVSDFAFTEATENDERWHFIAVAE